MTAFGIIQRYYRNDAYINATDAHFINGKLRSSTYKIRIRFNFDDRIEENNNKIYIRK